MEMTTTTSAGWPCKGTDKGGGCCDAGVEPDSDLADPVTKKNMREIGSLPGDLEATSWAGRSCRTGEDGGTEHGVEHERCELDVRERAEALVVDLGAKRAQRV
jgi:hypothetical protein